MTSLPHMAGGGAGSRLNAFLSKRLRRASVVKKTIEVLELREMLSAVSWIAAASGFWDDPNNWSTGQVPGSSNDLADCLFGIEFLISQNC